jgi:hypothetical protein
MADPEVRNEGDADADDTHMAETEITEGIMDESGLEDVEAESPPKKTFLG